MCFCPYCSNSSTVYVPKREHSLVVTNWKEGLKPWVLQETLKTTVTDQNIRLEGNAQLKPRTRSYIGLVKSVWVIWRRHLSHSLSQTRALRSCISPRVTLFSSQIFPPVPFLLSQLIFVHTICWISLKLQVSVHFDCQFIRLLSHDTKAAHEKETNGWSGKTNFARKHSQTLM